MAKYARYGLWVAVLATIIWTCGGTLFPERTDRGSHRRLRHLRDALPSVGDAHAELVRHRERQHQVAQVVLAGERTLHARPREIQPTAATSVQAVRTGMHIARPESGRHHTPGARTRTRASPAPGTGSGASIHARGAAPIGA